MKKIMTISAITLLLVGCSDDETDRGMTIDELVVVKNEIVEEEAASAEEEAEDAEDETEEEVVEEEVEEEEVEVAEEDETEEEVDEDAVEVGVNLFDPSTVEQGRWMAYDGQIRTDNSEMVLSQSIEYDPTLTYAINTSVYVSYLEDERFIETIRYSDVSNERLIEPREAANNIRISIPSSRANDFEIVIK